MGGETHQALRPSNQSHMNLSRQGSNLNPIWTLFLAILYSGPKFRYVHHEWFAITCPTGWGNLVKYGGHKSHRTPSRFRLTRDNRDKSRINPTKNPLKSRWIFGGRNSSVPLTGATKPRKKPHRFEWRPPITYDSIGARLKPNMNPYFVQNPRSTWKEPLDSETTLAGTVSGIFNVWKCFWKNEFQPKSSSFHGW